MVMEIQSLVRAGKMQRVKSNAFLQRSKSGGPRRALDRKISINSGASPGSAFACELSPLSVGALHMGRMRSDQG